MTIVILDLPLSNKSTTIASNVTNIHFHEKKNSKPFKIIKNSNYYYYYYQL